MTTNQEKILNCILFFFLSLTGLASLLLVKNNYLYVFVFIFLILYWQKDKIVYLLSNYLKSPPSFLTFLILGMVGVLLFQVFSRSPRFYQRPVLTLIVSLIFYLLYFFLWYKIFLKRKSAILETFFLSGFGGIIFFGLTLGRLTTTVLTAPNLASGLFYALLKASGIFTVVGVLTAFPFLFFSNEKETLPVRKEEKKKSNSGFGLIEVLVGGGLFFIALSLVGIAHHQGEIARQKLQVTPLPISSSTPTNIPKVTEGELKKPEDTDQPRPQVGQDDIRREESESPTTERDEIEERPVPQTGRKDQGQKELTDEDFDDFYDQVATYNTCQTNPSIPGCEVYYYDPYEDPNSPEYQQKLEEEWWYYQQQTIFGF